MCAGSEFASTCCKNNSCLLAGCRVVLSARRFQEFENLHYSNSCSLDTKHKHLEQRLLQVPVSNVTRVRCSHLSKRLSASRVRFLLRALPAQGRYGRKHEIIKGRYVCFKDGHKREDSGESGPGCCVACSASVRRAAQVLLPALLEQQARQVMLVWRLIREGGFGSGVSSGTNELAQTDGANSWLKQLKQAAQASSWRAEGTSWR
jgi:hypothetical protein